MKMMVALSFTESTKAVEAIETLKARGFKNLDCYGPFGPDDIFEAIGPMKSRIPLAGLIGGITGGVSGFYLQWWTSVRQYPMIVGGRPLNSWPAFIPITFELTILFATFAIFFTYLYSAGYPCLYHKVFDIPGFERASNDTFFICLTETEEKIASLRQSNVIESLNADRISYVTA